MKSRIEKDRVEESQDLLSKAVLVTDTEGTVNWTNQAFRSLCGYSKVELLGKSVEDLFLEDETDRESAIALREAVTNGRHLNFELLNHHKEGTPYWVSVELNPMKNEAGILTGFIAIEHDVTELHHQELAIQQGIDEVCSAILSVKKKAQALKSEADSGLS